MAEKGRVCVTGAGGYVASWLVKLLLSKGYYVHGTVREPSDKKYSHLQKLNNATNNLQLFKADLMDYKSISTAIEGCIGVFHVASPVPSSPGFTEMELVEPAVKGTLYVLRASTEANIKRVVIVSSAAAVVYNPAWPKDKLNDETCWSDKDYCRNLGNVVGWYALSKTEAELTAVAYGKASELDVITICPILVFGPLLLSRMNASSSILYYLLKEGNEIVDNTERMIVDVRDLSEALVLAYEKPEANGRYICTSHPTTTRDLVGKLRSMYPSDNYPKSFKEAEDQVKATSEKLQKLGWSFRTLDETLADSIESYKQAGFLE